MNGGHLAMGMNMVVKHGDVAEADQPFGIRFEFGPVDTVNDPERTIPSPGAHDGFYLRIVQHLLKIGKAFIIGTAKAIVLFPDGITWPHCKAPAFYYGSSGLDLFMFDGARR